MKRLVPLLMLPLAACGTGIGELGFGLSLARFGLDAKSTTEASAATPAPADVPLPEGYPGDIRPLRAPLNADLAYRPFAKRDFRRRIAWRAAPGDGGGAGPELVLETRGSIAAAAVEGGVALTLERGPTRLVAAGDTSSYRDQGLLRVAVTPVGHFGDTEFRFAGLGSGLERHYMEAIGRGLMRRGRVVAYRPRPNRTGPADAAAGRIEVDERQARRAVVRAVEPLTGIVMGLPAGGVSGGDSVILLRRNLGLLFRGRHDIPVTVEGVGAGMVTVAGRRLLVIDAGEAASTGGHHVAARGFGLLDMEAGVFLKTDVTLRLTVGRTAKRRLFIIRDTSVIGACPDA